jgi:quinoprotein glucose dehydrogenase
MSGRSIASLLCGVIIALQGALARASSADHNWPVRGGSKENTHYSSLSQINRGNVEQLQPAWRFETGDAFPGSEMQCNPLVIDGVMYIVSPKADVIALNAATGELMWRFRPLEGRRAGKMRLRGLAYWSDGRKKRIYASARNFLYALDAATGDPVEDFGDKGRIDLRTGLGRPNRDMVSLSSPGIVYRDLLIIGSSVSEALPAPPGDIRAYDVRSGELRWRFHTIPHPGEPGHETWPEDAWRYAGAANNWAGMALDETRGLVFAPTGSAAYDFYGENRHGDNLFANTLLALDAGTGRRVWHFQAVKHDLWDHDLPAAPTLVTLARNGSRIDAVAQITKAGFVYVFDRRDGRSLFPIEYRRAPASDLPGERAARSQPFPLLPEPFARRKLTEGDLSRRTPAANEAARARFRQLRKGDWEPPSLQGTLLFPGFDGGGEWGGAAFDPQTGHLFVNANEMANILKMRETGGNALSGKALYEQECASCHGADRKGFPPEFPSLQAINERRAVEEIYYLLYTGSGRMPSFARLGAEAIGAIFDYVVYGRDASIADSGNAPRLRYMSEGYPKFLDADGYPAIAPPWGTLSSIDLNTGKLAWQIPLGEYPELAAQGMTNTGSENYGGPIVTAGGLLFIAATSYDRKFRAFDKDTGELLWETTLPAAGNATPATYAVDGRQYVAIAAGGGKSAAPPGGSIVVFALPES